MKSLVIISIIVLAGCSRQLHTSKSSASTSRQYSTKLTDTSHLVSVHTDEQTAYYGDTIAGTMYFDGGTADGTAAPKIDSIETGGIKVKVELQAVAGGFKARVNAVAKPVTVQDKKTDSSDIKKGIAQQDKEMDKAVIKTSKRDVKQSGIQWYWWVAGFFVVIVFCWFHFSLKKYL